MSRRETSFLPDSLPSHDLSWEPLVLDSREKIISLWEKLRDFPYIFDDNTKELPPDLFYNMLMNPTNAFYEVGDETGLVIATNVRPRMDANLHIVFFDRKIRGREPVLLEIIHDLVGRARLHRLTSTVRGDNTVLQKLMERLGFEREGVLRQASLRAGRYIDMIIYGILREEIV